jgi:CRP/FNR family transcriptional regulator, cyclic AMP receptor protein
VKVGDIFGERAAISASPRSATAVARSACRGIALDDKQFGAALQKAPEFALMMLGVLIQ